MWIRSQDKKILTEIHDVEIDSANQIWGSGSLIGEYSTEEKALKVLDYIHSILDANEWDISDLRVVFEMPADKDVEV